MKQTSSSATIPRFFECIFALRIQIVGFLLLWPMAGIGFETTLLRGLQDIDNRRVALVSLLAAGQAVFLAVMSSVVLLWVDVRLNADRRPVCVEPGRRLRLRRFISISSLLFWFGFMHDVGRGSNASAFWTVSLSMLLLVVFSVIAVEEVFNATRRRSIQYRLFVLPVPGISNDSFARSRAFFRSTIDAFRAARSGGGGRLRRLRTKTRRLTWRLRRHMLTFADWVLGPGFLDYKGRRPRRFLPGFVIAFVWLTYLILTFEDAGRQFLQPDSFVHRFRLLEPSPLSMVLSGVLLVIATLSFLSFYADRFRLPVSVLLLGLITVATQVSGADYRFRSERLRPDLLNGALTPREVVELSPRGLIVVAAAGGGIQASGWTTQVLTGLREGDHGEAFKRALRVISGVSGGAVGAAFYAGTYEGVWNSEAATLEDARGRSMASSLSAVLWGLVYPDMHRLLLPIPRPLWTGDRGFALERSIASTATQSAKPGPGLLSLAPLVRDGLPVLLLNATLSADASPVTFTNSRYPDPGVPDAVVRVRSFHDEFQRDVRLETAARLSATYPIVSPAAKPEDYTGHNSFVDGGYFDNSGLYALMAWLTEATARLSSSTEPRELLLLTIESFPETATDSRSAKMSWYPQFTIPLQTLFGVRTSGESARNLYLLPLLKNSLAGKFQLTEVQFRYVAREGCTNPPLSWHLTDAEKQCIADAWKSAAIREAREEVGNWLARVR